MRSAVRTSAGDKFFNLNFPEKMIFQMIHMKQDDAIRRIVSSIQNTRRDTSRKNGRAEGAQLEEHVNLH